MAEQKKRGPKPVYGTRKEFHLKLSENLAEALKQVSNNNVQAYMERVLRERPEIIEILSQQEGDNA